VLLDKLHQIKTVVNKLTEIDNTYRNFSFEILAGVENTSVECKENGCLFRFDFAKVYWNPRLGIEHEHVVKLLNRNDLVYDVFAGVGPFSVPAVTNRKCTILANDLNPESYRYLLENYTLNNKSKQKKKEQEARRAALKELAAAYKPIFNIDTDFRYDPTQQFAAYNMDGREFIRRKLKYHLVETLAFRTKHQCLYSSFDLNTDKIYVLMNLPAMALDFLDSFDSLYDHDEADLISRALDKQLIQNVRLNIFCYHFCKGGLDELESIKKRIRHDIYKNDQMEIESRYIRKVAPNKDMYCTMFKLNLLNLFADDCREQSQQKKVKLDNSE
jgi:tRNA (guanine37-N1)-methyltransferase